MNDTPKLYIAGIGMITPVGANTAMTAAAVKAGISGYAVSDYYGNNNEPITMASLPYGTLESLGDGIIEGSRRNERHERVIKMAIVALHEACAQVPVSQAIPLVLAMPEQKEDMWGLTPFIDNVERNCQPWVSAKRHRAIDSGRAAGIEAIDYVFQHLDELRDDYVLVGGSDSYRDYSRIAPLSKQNRLLSPGNRNGFAPGEAACFLVLTRRPEQAQVRNGHLIALHPPGIAEEPGHWYSEEPYRGDGLDQAFKKALMRHAQGNIHSIYSSMNGEHHWAKEYGVAYIRNQAAFADPVKIEHPADIFGDLGSATGTALIGLAAEDLFSHPKAKAHLVYSSSDHAKRGAIVLEKIPFQAL